MGGWIHLGGPEFGAWSRSVVAQYCRDGRLSSDSVLFMAFCFFNLRPQRAEDFVLQINGFGRTPPSLTERRGRPNPVGQVHAVAFTVTGSKPKIAAGDWVGWLVGLPVNAREKKQKTCLSSHVSRFSDRPFLVPVKSRLSAFPIKPPFPRVCHDPSPPPCVFIVHPATIVHKATLTGSPSIRLIKE